MRSMRHPNPLVDVRRPRNRETVGVNPPGFIWKALDGVREYRLQICRDRTFAGPTLLSVTARGERTLFVPRQPLEAGRWYWRWGANGAWSQVFSFEVLADAAEIRIGSAEELVAQLGEHPRAMVRRGGLGALRARPGTRRPSHRSWPSAAWTTTRCTSSGGRRW
jgi:hypothetical protein